MDVSATKPVEVKPIKMLRNFGDGFIGKESENLKNYSYITKGDLNKAILGEKVLESDKPAELGDNDGVIFNKLDDTVTREATKIFQYYIMA